MISGNDFQLPAQVGRRRKRVDGGLDVLRILADGVRGKLNARKIACRLRRDYCTGAMSCMSEST